MKHCSIYIAIIYIIVASFSISILTANTASPYSFMSNALTPRSAGLGGASVTLENEPGNVLINPAVIRTNTGRNFNATFQKHLLDINSGNATYIYNDSNYGAFAGSVLYTNYGSFDYYNENGDPMGGSFSGNLVALSFSYANKIAERLYGGVSLKFMFNQLEKMNGFGVAVDAGLLYKLADERTKLGFSILNAGTEIERFGPTKADIPLDVRIGFSHRLRGLPLLFNLGFNHLGDEGNFGSRFENINIGGELYFGEVVRVRVGFDNYYRKHTGAVENKGSTGFSFGAGVVTNIIDVDYSISILTNELFIHRFGINLEI